jgi:hypothetical protein
MTASRPTHFAHIDGTVSTRNSKTRVYAWAVEEVRDLHAEAISMEYRAKELERELETFEAAATANQVSRKTKPWSYPAGASYQEFYLEDPSGGERIYIGAQVVDADGKPVREEDAFNRAVEIVKHRERLLTHIASTQAKAQELAAGPRYGYRIVRWSERRDSAAKALNTFQREHAAYHLVEAQEGKAPAPVEAPAPAPAAPVEAPAEAPKDDREADLAAYVQHIADAAAKDGHFVPETFEAWRARNRPTAQPEPELELIRAKGVRLTLGRAGHGGALVRRGVGFGGYNIPGAAHEPVRYLSVYWRSPDGMADANIPQARRDTLAEYTEALEARGYTVENDGKSLTVTKRKR